MRLIDADALIPIMKYTTTDNEIGVFPIRIGFNAIKEVIDESPTIDAVEVVRCKECRYFKKIVERSDSGLCYRDLVASAWKENGYCSRGERRKDDEA